MSVTGDPGPQGSSTATEPPTPAANGEGKNGVGRQGLGSVDLRAELDFLSKYANMHTLLSKGRGENGLSWSEKESVAESWAPPNDDAGFRGDISRPVSDREKDFLDKWREFLGRGDMYESAEIQYLKRQGAYLERYRKHMEVCRVRTE